MKIKNFLLSLIVIYQGIVLGNDCDLNKSDFRVFYQPEYGAFDVGADWLYWEVEQDFFRVKEECKFSNGIRIYADYKAINYCWKWKASYTSLHSERKDTRCELFKPIYFNLLSCFGITAPSSLKSTFDIDYVDLDFSKDFFLSENFILQPHLGLRGQWLKKKITTVGANELPLVSTLTGKLYGGGVEGGLLGIWNVGCNFSMIGDLGGSLVYAYSGSKNSVKLNESIKSHFLCSDASHKLLPSLDTFLGLNYFQYFFHKSLNMRAGWETRVIFKANFFSKIERENLFLQGLTFGSSIGF